MKISIYTIWLYLLILSVSSCSDEFLDREPLGSLNDAEYFKTDNAAGKLVVNCYIPMLDGWGYSVNKVAIGEESVDNADGGGWIPVIGRKQSNWEGAGHWLPIPY